MLRLLIVDDDVIVRKWLRLVFQPFAEEFSVVAAVAGGREALEICQAQQVDVVITDMIMPDMDGMAFIQALRAFDLRAQVVILSNYADFSLAQKGMSFGAAEYLLKGEITEEELLAVTRRVGRKLLAGAADRDPLFLGLTPLQTGQLLSGCAPEAAALFDAALAAEGGRVWCIVFSQDAPVRGDQPQPTASGAEWARQLTALLSEAQLPAIVCVVTDHIAAALVLLKDPPQEAAARFARQAKLLPGLSAGPSFSVGAAGPAANAAELALAFSHACGVIHRRFFLGPGAVCFYSGPEARAAHPADFREEARLVQELVQGGELNRLKALMERVCAQRDRYAVDDIDQLRRLFNIAAEALIHHTQICCPCAAELQVLDTNPLAVIGGMSFLDDLLDWLRGLIDTCHGLLQRAAGDGNMRRVFTYIEQNYMHNLTLNSISEVAGFSPNYFCNVFKEYTGKSVSAYLTDLRIQHAKQLLTATNKSINLIAEEVGYESSSYFIKVFKDLTGVTPNHFRRVNR